MFSQRQKRINNREPGKICCWSLITMLSLCLFSYGYFVRGITVNIVTRQNMESDISSLSSRVLALESDYIKAKNSITGELASNMGFVPVSNQKFVQKQVNNPGLSLITPGN
jgi:hypothetical protein